LKGVALKIQIVTKCSTAALACHFVVT